MKTFQEYLIEKAIGSLIQLVKSEIKDFSKDTPWLSIEAALRKNNVNNDDILKMKHHFKTFPDLVTK